MREGVALCTHRLIVRGQKTVPRYESRPRRIQKRIRGPATAIVRAINYTDYARTPFENHNLKKERGIIFLDLSINRLFCRLKNTWNIKFEIFDYSRELKFELLFPGWKMERTKSVDPALSKWPVRLGSFAASFKAPAHRPRNKLALFWLFWWGVELVVGRNGEEEKKRGKKEGDCRCCAFRTCYLF